MIDYEIRSDEENIGNVLWVVEDRVNGNDEDYLKKLWIEAEEYADCADQEYVSKQYLKDKKAFKDSEVSLDNFLGRAETLIQKIVKSEDAICLMSGDEFEVKKLKLPDLQGDAIARVLLDDFSSLMVFVEDRKTAMLFCWNDVV
jgi:hypothetical protein